MPGAEFKRTAREWKATWMALAEIPIKFARKQIKEKSYSPSYVSELYERVGEEATADDQELIKWTAASMYAAGADTVRLFLFFTHSPSLLTADSVQVGNNKEFHLISPSGCSRFSSSGWSPTLPSKQKPKTKSTESWAENASLPTMTASTCPMSRPCSRRRFDGMSLRLRRCLMFAPRTISARDT